MLKAQSRGRLFLFERLSNAIDFRETAILTISTPSMF